MKLTAKSVAALKLPHGKRDAIEFDDAIPGFGLRLREGGSRTWVFQYKFGARHRRMVLGRATAIPADKARQIASELHARVRLGGDPANDKAAAVAALVFGEVAKRYLEAKTGELRPRSLAEVTRYLEDAARPLHGQPVTSIDRRTIADQLSRVARESGPVSANRLRATMSAMFGWAIREGLVDANPVIGTGKREERSRDRVLTDAELSAVWAATQDDRYGAIVRLLILTGSRAREISDLRWSEIDFNHGKIALPAERTKNGRPHEIPMSSAVQEILCAQPKSGDRVFGTFSGWSRLKTELDARIRNPEPWVVHDLRRTAATRMGDLGIAPHVVEAVLNHQSGHKGGIAGVYNRALYAAEKAQALALWADHVMALAEGRKSNVTPLKRA